MIIVIIAGGQGTRLWPLSTTDKPKHLLALTNNKSLLRNTYDRVRNLTDKIYIVPEVSHADQILEQLPELGQDNLIVEPGRRGTASCVLLALATLEAKYGADEDIVFLHADHHITDTQSFLETVKLASSCARIKKTISLIGLKPTYPATGFGYIKKGQKAEGIGGFEVYGVDSFVEKPNQETAQHYIESGEYLWNLGLFAGPIKSFIQECRLHAPELYSDYKRLLENVGDDTKLNDLYLSLENRTIDTELIEKVPDLLVVPGAFGWADIGSFSDLHAVMGSNEENIVRSDKSQTELLECNGCLVMNTNEGKPVVSIGLRDIVVIDTPNGTLVCHKDHCQDIKKALALLDT